MMTVISAGVICATLAQHTPPPIKAVDMLVSEESAERKQGEEQILKERARLISQLTAIISKPGKSSLQNDSVEKAMSILGKLRATEAIDVLVDHIGFPFVRYPGTEKCFGPEGGMGMLNKSIEQLLPAVPALIEIGEPCVAEVINKLWTTDGGFETKACMVVLRKLDQHSSVRARLEKTLEDGTPRSPDSLREVLKMLGKEAVSGKQ